MIYILSKQLESRLKISKAKIGNKCGLGNKPSLETRRKRSEKMKGNKLGIGGKSNSGYKWITDGQSNKMFIKHEKILDGWRVGRII
jgi:hypothetical protein